MSAPVSNIRTIDKIDDSILLVDILVLGVKCNPTKSNNMKSKILLSVLIFSFLLTSCNSDWSCQKRCVNQPKLVTNKHNC